MVTGGYSGLGMLDRCRRLRIIIYSDIRWHAFCRAIIAGTLEATSRLHSLSLRTYIHIYVYMHVSDKSFAFSLSLVYMLVSDKSFAFSLSLSLSLSLHT